jgi:hypothetical protein
MRADIEARKRDQQRNGQKRKAEPPADKKQRPEKCRGCGRMTGWKRMIFRAPARSIPNRFAPDRGTRSTACNFDEARRCAGERARNEHGSEDARPFFIAAPIGNHNQHEPQHDMRRPISPTADGAHESPGGAALMLRDPVLNGVIEVKCTNERSGGEGKEHGQTEPALLCHSKISHLYFMRRYL